MNATTLYSQIREDWVSNGRDWTKPGFRAIAVQRFGVWRMCVRSKLLRAPLSLLYRMMFRYCRNGYGIELPYSVKIGRRLVIEHQGGIVVHGNTVIGDDCILRQNCTLGIRDLSTLDDAPTLGDRVELGAGAVIIGKVRLGDGVRVGANAVVLSDVPAGALAAGVPAQIRIAKDDRA